METFYGLHVRSTRDRFQMRFPDDSSGSATDATLSMSRPLPPFYWSLSANVLRFCESS